MSSVLDSRNLVNRSQESLLGGYVLAFEAG
uniref:Uncharacterized protein n=1 Tax=Solanum lycopersicum TaxID=4081 RepID=K4CYN9_SOLLC